MVIKETRDHFNKVSRVWENKIWVNDESFDEKVISIVSLSGNEIALEVGIGTGAFAKKFQVKEMYGIDISKKMMELATIPKQRLIEGKGESIPFLDKTFDLVVSRNLLKHCLDPTLVLKEMYRVIKDDGKLVIVESTPIEDEHIEIPTIALRVVEPYHPRFRSHRELINMMKEVPLKKIQSEIFIFRRKWLNKWCEAKKASKQQKEIIFNLYKNAPIEFKKGQNVEIFEEEKEILNDFPWTIIIGSK